MKPQTYKSIQHRRALELEAMPTLARAVFESSEKAKKTGERVREAIDGLLGESNEAAAGCQGGARSAAPQTLAEALDVIRAMHNDLTAFRCPDFYQFLNEDKIGEFDGRVKAVLAHSAPVIKADRHDSDCAQHNEPAMPAGPCDCSASDSAIEAEIQAKGLTAPRVTPADLQANIVHKRIVVCVSPSGQVLRWAVLTTRNGFAVTGRPSVSVSPENDNAEIGEKVAIDNAMQELWPLMGYALKERLAAPPSIQLTPAEVQSGLDRVRWAEGLIKQLPEDHDGRNSWLLNYGTDKAERQAEWARRNPQSSLAKNIAAAPDLRPAADAQGQ